MYFLPEAVVERLVSAAWSVFGASGAVWRPAWAVFIDLLAVCILLGPPRGPLDAFWMSRAPSWGDTRGLRGLSWVS
eukprot:5338751-Pyramimonas_sp.AAC.1